MSHSPMELAVAYIRAGELADALDALNEHLTNDPGDDDARRTRVEVWLRLGGERHWTAALDELAALSETTAADHYTRSVLLERLGRLDEAQSAARAAVDVASDEAFRGKAVDRLLDLAHKRGDADGALRVALENDWASRAGDAALALDDAQAAYDHYTKALMRTEKLSGSVSDEIAANIRARIRLQRAGAALRIGLLPEADADYAAAGTVIPDDPMIPFNRGEIALRQGDAEAAATFFKVAYDGANPTLRKLMWEAAAADDVLSVAWAAIVDESS